MFNPLRWSVSTSRDGNAGPSSSENQAQPAGDIQVPPPLPVSAQGPSSGAGSALTRTAAWKSVHRIDEEHVYKNVNQSKTAKTIEGMIASDLFAANVVSATDAVAVTEAPRENLHTERKVKSLLRDWALLIVAWAKIVAPHVEFLPHMRWDSDHVLAFAPIFLHLRLNVAKERDGSFVKAITLFNWATILIKCVIRYTTGSVSGDTLLLQKGLYEMIWNTVKKLIREKDLDRHQRPKVYYGRWEVLLILAWLLRVSHYGSRNERLVKLQIGCLFLICFYIMARPGSLAPSSDEDIRRRMLLLLGDVKVYLHNGIWDCAVSIKIRNWKGQKDSTTATTQEYVLESVTKAHNVTLDPTVWIITYMLERGAFGPEYKTLEDLEGSDRATLEVVPEMREEPFFLAIELGGHDLVRGKPATVQNLSQIIRSSAIAAGLPGAGATALRRDGGNDYGTKVGAMTARLGMGHNNPGQEDNVSGGRTTTFHRYYTVGTGQVSWVGIRLGEILGKTDAATMHELHIRDFMRAAIDAWLNATNAPLALTAPPKTDNAEVNKMFAPDCKLSDENKATALADVKVVESRRLLKKCWESFLECFPPIAKTYQHEGNHTTATIGRLIQRFPRSLLSPKETYEREHALRNALKGDGAVRKAVNRQVLAKQRAATRVAAQDPNRPGNTSVNRREGISTMNGASGVMLVEAVSEQLGIAPAREHTSLILAAAAPQLPTPQLPTPQLPAPQLPTPQLPTPQLPVPQLPVPTGEKSFLDVDLSDMRLIEAEDMLQIFDESLEAPQASEGPDAWQGWKDRVEKVHAQVEGRDGSAEEEYALLNDTSLTQSLLHIATRHRQEKQLAPIPGGTTPQLQAIMKSAGVPTMREIRQADAALPEEPADDDAAVTEPQAPKSDKGELDILGLPCDKLRALLARWLLSPLQRNRLIEAWFKDNGNRWLCPLCREFHHNGAATLAWPDRARLEDHMKVHTAWHDLELEMRPKDGCDQWRCPSCRATAATMQAIRAHCVTKCPDKETYLEMQASHAAINGHKCEERRRTDKERVVTRGKSTEETNVPFEGDDDAALGLVFRKVILGIRNWDIGRMVQDAIDSGDLPIEGRDSKTASLQALMKISEAAWESPDFYSIPFKCE